MTEKTLPPSIAAELYESEDGERDASGAWARIAKQHIRTGRWFEQYYLVVSEEPDVFWGVDFNEGLTEEQENDLPWQMGMDAVPLVRLYPREVISTEYRTKPAEVTG